MYEENILLGMSLVMTSALLNFVLSFSTVLAVRPQIRSIYSPWIFSMVLIFGSSITSILIYFFIDYECCEN